MSDMEMTTVIQKFAKEKEVANLLAEGGIERLIGQYKTISHRLDSISNENRELRQCLADLESENENLKKSIDKMSVSKSEWIDKAAEWQQKCEKLEKEQDTSSSEIDTSTPLDCANSLIHHMTHLEAFLIAPERYERTFTVDDLEQIAEHLLVYCKHNRESE